MIYDPTDGGNSKVFVPRPSYENGTPMSLEDIAGLTTEEYLRLQLFQLSPNKYIPQSKSNKE